MDRDSGHRTTVVVAAPWCALWIWRWFVQPAIVWSRGGMDRVDSHTDIPLHCAYTLVEVAGPAVHGGGTTVNVREATCATGWPQGWGGEIKMGRIGVQRWDSPGATEAWEKEGEKRQNDRTGLARTWMGKRKKQRRGAREQ